MNEGSDDDDDDDDDDLHVQTKKDEMMPFLLPEPNKVLSGIAELKTVGIIDKGLCEHLTSLRKANFKCIPSTGLRIYEEKANQQC